MSGIVDEFYNATFLYHNIITSYFTDLCSIKQNISMI